MRCPGDGREESGGAPAQGDEADAPLLQTGESGIGGQTGIEDQFAWPGPGMVFPVFGEPQDLVVLVSLAHGRVDVAEQAGLAVAGDEGEETLLPPGTL